MKKLLSVLLAFVMVFSFASVTAFAEDTTNKKGSITIQQASTNSTYEVYRILDLHSFDTQSGRYSYKTNTKWAGFFATDAAKQYVAVDEDGYVNWINQDADVQRAEAPGFAKAALAWAQANGITPEKSTKNEGQFTVSESTIKFSDLELGYYLVDSTVGALCGLTTTNFDASINAKNTPPTLTKFVQEDSTSAWVAANTAEIGETVNFWVEIKVHAGAQNYVLLDKMHEGFTFNAVTSIDIDGVENSVKSTDYTVVTDDANSTFKVVFTEEFCNKLTTGSKINVYYNATLNSNAVIAGEGTPNVAWLTYGQGGKTEESKTVTKAYAFDIVKTDGQDQLIDGAKFKLYRSETGTDEVELIKTGDGKYRVALASEQATAEIEIVTASQASADLPMGTARVSGLDNGKYYLEETVAPVGYNKLTKRREIIIADANHDAIFDAETGVYTPDTGIQIINQTGTMLPQTGGMGTMLFVALGTVVVLGAGVLLVTKKRMSMIED